ncbi:Aldehyde dehydrogenase [Candidatus Accumulibacter aalborgensis]|uniref:Aldehyde dehydrogenase n=1 Tax=Candidatus Accumulibacter aalborgensis TaxID=1860102 RepID=A0A1A8XPY1_9PROT|nr:aldehyde dehydrogenase family protein [Candidatus Accumulibacter aalborgensis]SBT06507.1 Aldehyde dehydrogenase [Candidatus Accumulibacter aalborgensis]
MTETDEILAIPLWINGHAYLTMAPAFFDVRDPRSGQIKRRTPLCGSVEALAAVDSASAALPAWSARAVGERAALLALVGDELAAYAEHFAGLIAEETGKDAVLAAAEVGDTVALLRGAASDDTATTGSSRIVAIVSDDGAPLLGLLQAAVPALLTGATVILKPSPKAPAAAFALAELTALSGFPGGVVNVLQGDLAAIEGLCAAQQVSLVFFAGDPALGARVSAIADRHGKPFAD